MCNSYSNQGRHSVYAEVGDAQSAGNDRVGEARQRHSPSKKRAPKAAPPLTLAVLRGRELGTGRPQPYPDAAFGLAFARGLWRPTRYTRKLVAGCLNRWNCSAKLIHSAVMYNKIASRPIGLPCNLTVAIDRQTT
jgi:hypothetical protein